MRELIEIRVATERVEAIVATPDETDAHPGVLLFMDAFGLRPQIEAMADRIASWGYVVLAPNTLYRSGRVAKVSPPADLRDPDTVAKVFARVMPMVGRLDGAAAAVDVPAYVAALRALPQCAPGAIGVTGYCMGARLATRAAGLDASIAACGGFHGGRLATDDPDSPHRGLSHARAAFVYGHADEDAGMDAEAQSRLDAALVEAGVRHTTAVYPGARHGFTMADTGAYDAQAAQRHYAELEALLRDTLERP